MKQVILLVSICLLNIICVFSQQTDFVELSGPYLGQTPPGITPEVFAPGTISNGFNQEHCTFSPDGRECFYSITIGYFEVILWTYIENNHWKESEIAPFSGKYYDGFPSFHPDGTKLFFHSFRPEKGNTEPTEKANIWFVEKTSSGWGEPQMIGHTINGKGSVSGPSVTTDGTLYFAQWQDDGSELAMRATFVNGEYQIPEVLPKQINATDSQFHFCISPDEDYLIIPIGRRDELEGGGRNYYVSFRDGKGQWSNLVDIGDCIRSIRPGSFPSISADGKYFFFQAKPSVEFIKVVEKEFNYTDLKDQLIDEPTYDRGAIYWVSTKIIQDLKPECLK